MDDLRLPAVAARLVAWHNRHPLARRITAAQVHAIGYVALPFAGSAAASAAAQTEPVAVEICGGSLRERALARARQVPQQITAAPTDAPDATAAATWALPTKDLAADFSEDFIDPLRPSDIARFALRAGRLRPAGAPGDGPVREVRSDGGHRGRATVPVYLLTAAIETGTRRSRVLLGAGGEAPVLGHRILSLPRVAAAALAVLAMIGGLSLVLKRARPVVPEAPAASAPASSAAASAALDLAPGRAAHVDGQVSVVEPAASAGAPAASVGERASSPIVPVLGDAEKAAARAATAALRQASGPVPAHAPSPRTPAPTPAPAPAPVSPPAQAAPPPPMAPREATPPRKPTAPTGTAFALSTRTLRTRAEADQVRAAMQALLRTVAAAEVQVEVLPEGDDWRVVSWPFARKADAQRARELLVSRGMRVQVIDF